MARTADRRLQGRKWQKVTVEDMGPNALPLIYVKITEEQVVTTKEYLPGVMLDLDVQGRLVGIELLNAQIELRQAPPRVPDLLPYDRNLLGTWTP